MRTGCGSPSINGRSVFDGADKNNALKLNMPYEPGLDAPGQISNVLHPNVPPSRELLDGQSVNQPCYSVLGCKPASAIQTKADGSVYQVAQSSTQAEQFVDSPSFQSGLSPVNLIRPLPSIVSTAPVDVRQPCSDLNRWIADNPLLAIGMLGVAAYYAFKK